MSGFCYGDDRMCSAEVNAVLQVWPTIITILTTWENYIKDLIVQKARRIEEAYRVQSVKVILEIHDIKIDELHNDACRMNKLSRSFREALQNNGSIPLVRAIDDLRTKSMRLTKVVSLYNAALGKCATKLTQVANAASAFTCCRYTIASLFCCIFFFKFIQWFS